MAGAKADNDKNKDMRDALAAGKRGPRPGDFVIIRGANWMNKTTGERDRDSSHIMVLLDILRADGKNVEWQVAQTGVGAFSAGYGRILHGGEITTLKAKLTEGDFQEGPESNKPKTGTHLVFNADITGESADFKRRVTTFTDVGKISFGMTPDKEFTDLFDHRWSEQANNDWMKTIAPSLGWYEETNPGGYNTAAPSYILLERGHEATRFAKAGGLGAYRVDTRGLWTRNRDHLEIEWARPPGGENANGWSQAWSVSTFVPREATIGTPLTPTAGTLTSVKQMPPQLPPEWTATHFIGA